MNRKVSIKVCGLHSAEGYDEADNIEVISIGSYYKRNGKHYIKYEELCENSSTVNSNLIKISPKQIEFITKGQSVTHMVFRLGEKNTTYYSTPFGGMNMSIDTYDLNVSEDEDFMSVDIRYGLEVNLDYVAECNVHIEIESLDDK